MSRLGLAILILVGLAAGPVLFSTLQNNYRLNRLEDRYLSLKHPARSELVIHLSKVGRLQKGGGRCRYLVGELRTAPGDLGTILAAYEGTAIEAVATKGTRSCAIRAAAFDENFPAQARSTFGFGDNEILKEVKEAAAGRTGLYFVACTDSGHEAGFDLRCR